MAQEHVTGAAGGQGGGPVRTGLGRLLRSYGPVESRGASRGQQRGDIEMRARAQPGRRAGLVHIAKQVEREQPAPPGGGIDPPLPAATVLVAALDVPARIPGVVRAGKADRNRAADAFPTPPPASADQLVAGVL